MDAKSSGKDGIVIKQEPGLDSDMSEDVREAKKDKTEEERGQNDSVSKPIAGDGRFMYVDVSLVKSSHTMDSNNQSDTEDPECNTNNQSAHMENDDGNSRTGNDETDSNNSTHNTRDDDDDETETVSPTKRRFCWIIPPESVTDGDFDKDSLPYESSLPYGDAINPNIPSEEQETLSTDSTGFVIKMEPQWESDTEMDAENLASDIVSKMSATAGSSKMAENTPSILPDGSRRFPCVECNASFAYLSDLRRHRRIHTGERPFVCHECDASFNRPDHLKYHMSRHAGNKQDAKRFVCNICDRGFTRKFDLKRHTLRVHSKGEPYPFICCECDARFVTLSELKKHKRVHSGEKPYACELCRAAFSQSCHLKAHLAKHTDNPNMNEQGADGLAEGASQRFPCTECNASFAHPSNLKRHQRIHTGERPFVCSQCNANFNRSDHLKYHEGCHAGLKNRRAKRVFTDLRTERRSKR